MYVYLYALNYSVVDVYSAFHWQTVYNIEPIIIKYYVDFNVNYLLIQYMPIKCFYIFELSLL